MRLAASVIAANWLIDNTFYFFFGNASVNFIAPVAVFVLAIFYFFWRSKSLNGAFIHKTFFALYSLYFLINAWHLIGRVFFKEALVANYWFSLAASNIVFILIVTTLWIFAILKFLDNNRDGGLPGVFERNIDKWRKFWGGR